MKIFGIKECGIKKYQSGTQEGGIQKQSEGEKFNQYLEQKKKQYPGAYTDPTPIWNYIKPSKEMKSYNEFLNDLKSTNPEEYNRIMENAAQSGTSEISKPWINADGNVRRSANVGSGFVSGTDPVGALYVEGVATAPVFNLIGKAAQYGLARAGNNWARAKILSKEMQNIVGDGQRYFGKVKYYGPTMGKTTASKTNPDLVDFDAFTRQAKETLAKKLNISTRVLQTDPKYAQTYQEMLEKQLDSWRRNPLNVNKTLVISKKGLADKNIYNNQPSIPDRQTFIQRQRNRGETDDANSNDWYNMLLKQNPNLRIDNRFVSEIEYNPHYIDFQPRAKRLIMDDKTIPAYFGKKYSVNDAVNPDGTINVRIAQKIQQETARHYGVPPMQKRTENPIWHKDDPNTFLHTKKVVTNAWKLPIPPGYTKQDQIISALGHDFGKIVAGDGHGQAGAGLLKQIFPDLTDSQFNAIYQHMRPLNEIQDNLARYTKYADIGKVVE